MPCYLFTYHSYQSWMPDRDEGFKRRDEVGVLAPNRALANVYRAQATESPAWLATSAQWEIVDELLIAREKQAFRLHYAATESTHVHALVSWNRDATWQQFRRSIRTSITRRLNGKTERRKWLGEMADAKRVLDDVHFRYLYDTYLPSHRGWGWCETKGWIEPRSVADSQPTE